MALAILGLLPGLSAAVPLLDCGQPSRLLSYTTEHDVPAHLIAHDHSICVQFTTNLAHPSGVAMLAVAAFPADRLPVPAARSTVPSVPPLPNPRAPPLA